MLAALRKIAEGDRRAYVALAWLLMPGAARVADRISRLADEIDAVVAGQLWVQVCEHDPADVRYVAKAWAMAVLVDAPGRRGRGGLMTPSLT